MADPFGDIFGGQPAQASTGTPSPSADPFADIFHGDVSKTTGETGTKQPAPITPVTPDLPEPTEPVEPDMPYNPFNPYVDPYPIIKPTPDMKAPPGAVPDISNRDLMKAPQFKERNGQNLYQNAVGDIGDIITGVATMANAGVGRAIQAAPRELQSIGIPGQGRPLFGNITKSYEKAAEELDRAHDAGQQPDMGKAMAAAMQHAAQDPDARGIGQFFGGLADYYNQRYIQPFGQGLGAGGTALEEQFWKHPIGTPLDLGLGGGYKTGAALAPELGGISARLATEGAYNIAGRPGVRAMRKLKRAPGEAVKNLKTTLNQRGFVDALMDEAFSSKNKEYLQWMQNIVNDLDESYSRIPDELKSRLTAGLENVDSETMNWIKQSPEAQHFIDTLRNFDTGWTQRAIDAGILTKEQVAFARYAPQFMAEMKRGGKSLKFKDLWTPEGMSEVMDYARAKVAQGDKEPLWMTIREAAKVRDFLVEKAGKPLGRTKEDLSFAMDRLEGQILQDSKGNYSLRPPSFETDALKLAKDGLLRTIRATLIQEAVSEIINNPALKAPQKGWVQVEADKIFGKAAQSFPAGTMIKHELGKTLYLPKEMAAGIEALANAPRITGMVWDLLLRKPSQMLSKMVLGLDPLRYPTQWLQNATIFGFTQLNSPRDIVPAAIAMGLAANPKVRNWIPAHFWTGQKAQKVAEEFSRDMPKYMEALMAPDKLLRGHLELVEKQDNYWRAATALSQAVKETMRVSNPKQLKLMNDSFRLSFWAQKNIKKLFQDEAVANQYFDEVKRTMGDYNKELKGVESAIADNVMFYRWKRHSMILTASLPFDNPHKTAALHAIAEVSRTMAESEPVTRRLKEAGAVVARDENGEPIIGPNGDVMVYLKGKTLAFMLTQLEDIRFIAKMANREGLGDVDQGSQPFVPFWNIIGAIAGIKTSTMGEFKNPDAVTAGSGGPQVRLEKAKAFMDGDYELKPEDFEQRPQPPMEATFGRNLLGPVYQAAVDFHERIQQIPGIPSDFSTIGSSVPKRTPTGEKRKPQPWSPFGKLQYTEPAMDQETEESIDMGMRNKLRKSFIFKTRDREDLR